VIFDELKFFNGKTEFLSSEKMAMLDDLVQRIELPEGVATNEAIAEEINEEVFKPVPEAEAEDTGTAGANPTPKDSEKLAKAIKDEWNSYPTPDPEDHIEDCITVATYASLHLPVANPQRCSAASFSAGGG
jgi:hypothetical protein